MTLRHTLNLGNSIIGVSILAMPYCFKKCGIFLGIILIIGSSLLNRAGCHLLLRAAIISRRRNLSILSLSTFGYLGKTISEVGSLGYLLGTCVAFFVVVGDLGPSLVSQVFSFPNGPHLRAFTMTFLGMFVVLPIGLLRRVDSLTSLSALSLLLYVCLVIKFLFEAMIKLSISMETLTLSDLNWWDSSAILSTLPIFAMALSCQPQIFEIFDTSLMVPDEYSSIKKMNKSIKEAVNLCSFLYITVGIFGYIAFHDKPFRGNILLFLPSSFTSTATKIFFILTVIISLPLCFFPCRTSLHSIFFRKTTGSLLGDITTIPSIYMSDAHFRFLTIFIIIITIGISLLLPHIELVLGLIGSTIGAIICFVFPALIFIHLTATNTTERFVAHLVAYVGVFILLVCSYTTFHDASIVNDDIFKDSIRAYSTKISVSKIDSIQEKIKTEDRMIDLERAKLIEAQAKVQAESNILEINKIRKEELIHKVEKQQQEQKKILNGMTKLDESHKESLISKSSSSSSTKKYDLDSNKIEKKSENSNEKLKKVLSTGAQNKVITDGKNLKNKSILVPSRQIIAKKIDLDSQKGKKMSSKINEISPISLEKSIIQSGEIINSKMDSKNLNDVKGNKSKPTDTNANIKSLSIKAITKINETSNNSNHQPIKLFDDDNIVKTSNKINNSKSSIKTNDRVLNKLNEHPPKRDTLSL